MELTTFAVFVLLVLAVVMMFAQVRLFSIDRTLKEILAELKGSKDGTPEDSQPLNPLSISGR